VSVKIYFILGKHLALEEQHLQVLRVNTKKHNEKFLRPQSLCDIKKSDVKPTNPYVIT